MHVSSLHFFIFEGAVFTFNTGDPAVGSYFRRFRHDTILMQFLGQRRSLVLDMSLLGGRSSSPERVLNLGRVLAYYRGRVLKTRACPERALFQGVGDYI